MTDEQVVKQVYPDARAWEHYPGDWQVGIGSEQVNGSRLITYANDSEQDAWADARARLPEGATTQPTPASDENEVDEEALLPCPFCGGIPRLGESEDGGHFIECSECGSSTNLTYFLMDDASRDVRERWNRRAK